MHPTKRVGMCATISSPTLERLRLHSIVSYRIVWWMQAAQASSGGEGTTPKEGPYSCEAQHQRTGRCAAISNPTLY